MYYVIYIFYFFYRLKTEKKELFINSKHTVPKINVEVVYLFQSLSFYGLTDVTFMSLLSWKLTFKNLTLLTKLNLFLTDAHLDWSLSTMYFSSTFLLATMLAKWMLPARPSPKRAKVTTELVSPVEPTLSVPWSANPCKYLINWIRWRLVSVWLLSFYFWILMVKISSVFG